MAASSATTPNGKSDLTVTTGPPAGDSKSLADQDLDELVTEHGQRIAGIVYRLLGWSDGAEDVVQEVFLAAFENLKRFRGDSEVSTWLTKIAINKCRTHHRKLSARLAALRRLAQRRSASGRIKTGARLEAEETSHRVRQVVQRLPATYREVVVLKYLEGLAISEVSELLGISEPAVATRLHRARHRLRGLLSDVGET